MQRQPTLTRHDQIDPRRAGAADHVLVVVFLRGGADGLSLVPPVGDDVYHRSRPVLRVAPEDALDLDGYFALHPGLAPLMPLYEAGDLAILHGVGSDDQTRSHFEAQDTMEHGGQRLGSGWLGRFMRARPEPAGALGVVAIGTTRPESLRGAPGGAVMQSVHDFGLGAPNEEAELLDALDQLYAVHRGPDAAVARSTLDAVRRLRTMRASADDLASIEWPESSFGRGLREVARLIRADVGLVATTIDLGGWDTHFVQLTAIDGLITDLATGLAAFQRGLGDHRTRVTTVVMTEFGRRVRENTSFGTDHGAGSILFTLGAGARHAQTGGTIRSGWTSLQRDQLDDVGDLPVTIDYRDALAPTLQWHSPGAALHDVFPKSP